MVSRGSCIHDDYEVWGLLGEGGMSEVWLAKHTVLCVPVIIKTLRRVIAEAAGEAGAKRMFNEARLMARVTNARVVRAIDAGIDDGTPYIVQEYVDGIDMAELDAQRRKAFGVGLPLWLVCHVMAETCEALHAAHQAGVIHRDVKPSNLFAAPESGIRLGDFGIAVAHADAPSKEISGTIKFMAPELLRGGVIDRTADVYGAGATAYDLRYGHAPYATLTEVLDEARVATFPVPQFPAEAYFQQLLRMMLSKEPVHRPTDLSEPGKHFALLAHALRGEAAAREALVCPSKNEFRVGGCDVVLRVGDVAREETDAFVSSAGFEMKMRSGSSESLRLYGGDEIEAEAMSGGDRALGSCVVTGAGKLKAKKVIHAVSAWNETSCIGRAMFRALLIAEQLGMRTLVLPALGTGASRVSLETCASAMMTALRWHLALGGSRLQRVTVVLGDEAKLKTYRDVAEEALRGQERALRAIDLGLPVEGVEATEDAATFLDAKSRVTGTM
jgi:serine/threonine-protein kinase